MDRRAAATRPHESRRGTASVAVVGCLPRALGPDLAAVFPRHGRDSQLPAARERRGRVAGWQSRGHRNVRDDDSRHVQRLGARPLPLGLCGRSERIWWPDGFERGGGEAWRQVVRRQ